MRRTKMAVLGMMMVLSMTACAGKAETKSSGNNGAGDDGGRDDN